MANSNGSVENKGTQPVDTDIVIGFLVSNTIVCLIYEFSLYLIIKMTQRNDRLPVGKILSYYAKVNMVLAPMILILFPGMIGLLPISTIFGNWFCGIVSFVLYYGYYFDGTLSFVVSCMVYLYFHLFCNHVKINRGN